MVLSKNKKLFLGDESFPNKEVNKNFAAYCAGHGPLKWGKKKYLKLSGRVSSIGWYFFSKKRKSLFFLEFNTHSALQTEHHKLDNSLFGIWDLGCALRSEGWGRVVLY